MTTFDERLKDIKDFFLGDNEVAGALYDTSEIGELHPEVKEYIKWHIKWLIKQAERVQELEIEIDGWREEVRKWQQFYEESEESHSETIELLHSTASITKRYREALNGIITLWTSSTDATDDTWLTHKMSETAYKALKECK